MPRIVQYNEQVQAPVGAGAPLARATAPENMGFAARVASSALEDVAKGGMKIADAMQTRADEEARAWSADTLSKARLQWTTHFMEKSANAEPGAPEFSSSILKDFDEYATKTVDAAPTRAAKVYLNQRLSAIRTEIGEKALTFEAQARVDFRTDQFTSAIGTTQRLMNTDPSQYSVAMAERLAEIDSSSIPPVKKSALREKAINEISSAAVWSQIQKSPTKFLQSIGFLDQPEFAVGAAPGMVQKGNINLNARTVLKNADGSISTERSMSFGENGVEILIPTVVDGKLLSDDAAIAHYRKTGEHLGKFDSPQAADQYAESLHLRQAQQYGPGGKIRKSSGNLSGVTGNTPFDALPFEKRSQLFEQAIRLKAQTDVDAEHAVTKQTEKIAGDGMKNAWAMIYDGKFRDAKNYIETIRPIIGAPQYHSLRTALADKMKGDGSGQKTDPGAFRELQRLMVDDPKAAQDYAFKMHRNGMLSNADLGSSVTRTQSLARQGGPDTEYEITLRHISRTLEPGAMVPDPVGRARQADAIAAFDRWVKENKPNDEQIRKRGGEIVQQYRFVNLSDTVLALPAPRSGQIRRNPSDVKGMEQDIYRAGQEAQRKFQAKQFTKKEYDDEMATLERWRKAISK